MLKKIISDKKNISLSLLKEWGFIEQLNFILGFLKRLSLGLWIKCRCRNLKGLVLCESNVKICHGRFISSIQGLNIEEGCEIVGLSKRGINFGKRCTLGRFCTIRPTNILFGHAGEGLLVGNNSNIGAYSYVGCSGFINIGNNVMIGPRVNLMAENHIFSDINVSIKSQGIKRSFITIKDDVWIGANVTIVAGVTVGKGSVIAAGAVVTKDIPEYSIAAGVPAKVIKSRK